MLHILAVRIQVCICVPWDARITQAAPSASLHSLQHLQDRLPACAQLLPCKIQCSQPCFCLAFCCQLSLSHSLTTGAISTGHNCQSAKVVRVSTLQFRCHNVASRAQIKGAAGMAAYVLAGNPDRAAGGFAGWCVAGPGAHPVPQHPCTAIPGPSAACAPLRLHHPPYCFCSGQKAHFVLCLLPAQPLMLEGAAYPARPVFRANKLGKPSFFDVLRECCHIVCGCVVQFCT